MATALYQQVVLDHQRAPRRFGVLDGCTHAADGINALCGDRLRIELALEGGRVADYRFAGEACAIATATASLLGEIALGRDPAELATLEHRFASLVRGALADGDDAELAGLNAMRALRRYPARRQCALLAFATLRAALGGYSITMTEKDPV